MEQVELNNVFNDNKYDIIFHFGAQALVSIASKNPLDTLKTNIFGTYNLLDKIIIQHYEFFNCRYW